MNEQTNKQIKEKAVDACYCQNITKVTTGWSQSYKYEYRPKTNNPISIITTDNSDTTNTKNTSKVKWVRNVGGASLNVYPKNEILFITTKLKIYREKINLPINIINWYNDQCKSIS